ncbi:SurA N-terminal domain-containing protein [Shewanella maritima]|uniref:SurA N-terminal domain-containing protein n=1 Tax=Shewanella maritima TaxID=2520507 RepID=UPI003736286B
MLEKIREGSQGVVAKTILVLVILSFAFTGVSSYLGSNTGVPAAVVNGDEISANQLEQAYQNERARLEQQFGEMFEALAADPTYMEGIKQSVLERLVADKLVDQAAIELGLRVSDDQIRTAIVSEPAFQTDGRFDNDRYLALLAQMGYQTSDFRNMMRTDMTRRQLVMSVVGSEFVLPGEAKQVAEIQGQTRDTRYLVVDAAPFTETVVVSDEDAQQFYNENQLQFTSPEMVSVEYVELNADDMMNIAGVPDEDIRAYYDDNARLFQTAEKRLAAHILIAASGDDSAELEKAQAALVKIQNGEDFAAVAKSDSDDQFSAEQGGQLDWFEPGVMDPAFDEALFALNQGEVSGVVKSDFGYHIIKLLDTQAGSTQAFDDVKDEILVQLQQRQAQDAFFGLQSKLADTSYEIPDTLIETAEAVGGEVKTTELFSRNSVPAPFNTPAFTQAAFSDQVIADGMNSDVIELSASHVVVVRLKEHKMAGTLNFEEVKADIVNRLKQQKANDIARVKATEYMAQFKAGDFSVSGDELVTVAKMPRFSQDTNPAITDKVFKMPKPQAGEVSIDTAELATGYAVVVLDKVHEADSIEQNLIESMQQRMASQYSEANYRSVINMLKAQAKIEYPIVE